MRLLEIFTSYWPIIPVLGLGYFYIRYMIASSRLDKAKVQLEVVADSNELNAELAEKRQEAVLELSNEQREQDRKEAENVSTPNAAIGFLRNSLRNRN